MSLFGSLLGGVKKSAGAVLLERLASASSSADELREALSSFNALSSTQPLRLVDKGGMAVLIGLLSSGDEQLCREALETISNLLDPSLPPDDPHAASVKAAHNAKILLANESYLTLATASIGKETYATFHGTQLLIRLLDMERDATQAAVLRQPEMVGSVLALLGEERDVVRNEALLLVARLAEGSADLQNILAFQGTNELLLSIIEAEKEVSRGRSRWCTSE